MGGFSPTAHGSGLASAEVVVASAVVVIAAAVMVVATVTTSGTVGRASSPRASPTDVGWIVRGLRPDIQAGEALHHVVVRRQE